MIQDGKTIAAVATGSGGAIAVIRLSGSEAFVIADAFFKARNGVSVCDMAPFTLSYGDFVASDGEIVDDLLLSKFVAPRSYTGEDMVELSVHASEYIKSRILEQLIARGARPAQPGEYTLRAYVNGKMDMLGAESVADIIASDSRAGHTLALSQMRGGYTSEFALLRSELVDLQSLIELELDFGEEDVEFADRSKLAESVDRTEHKLTRLIDSYVQGSAIKEGVPVAIIGAPNSGKSTLLNALLNEDRAIVSSIAGTTRDSIEETLRLGDVVFRFIDTAGMRATDDPLEAIGIEKARQKAQKARVVFLTVDISDHSHADDLIAAIAGMRVEAGVSADTDTVILLNKCDKLPAWPTDDFLSAIASATGTEVVPISAKTQNGLDRLRSHLLSLFSGIVTTESVLITSARHLEQLTATRTALVATRTALDTGMPTDLIAAELRTALHHLGLLTGEITTDEILGNIFSRFCIGK